MDRLNKVSNLTKQMREQELLVKNLIVDIKHETDKCKKMELKKRARKEINKGKSMCDEMNDLCEY